MGQALAEVLRDQHTWRYGYHCDCGAEMNSPATYSSHLADVVTAWLTANSGDTLATIRAHLPRDRYDDDGAPVGTYCSCGGWEGDYFADGEAGPFDEHLAAMVGAWLGTDAGQRAAETARNGPRSDLRSAGVNLDDGDDERRRAGQIECRHVWFDAEAEDGAELCVRCNSEREDRQ